MDKKWWILILVLVSIVYYCYINQPKSLYNHTTNHSRELTDEELREQYNENSDWDDYNGQRYEEYLSDGGAYQ